MCVFKVMSCLVIVSFYSIKVSGAEDVNSSATGYGYELIMAKLEYLQYKLIEIELTMKEDRETIDQKLTHQETLSEGLLWAIDQKLSVAIDQKLSVAIDQMRLEIGHNLTVLQTQSNKMISQQMACANHDQMRKEILALGSIGNRTLLKTIRDFDTTPKHIRSCNQEPSKLLGKYMIKPTENDESFEGYCEHTSFGGGWLVIQYRFDGSVDFYKNWTEYRNGFGRIGGEFWLGLERVHRMTSARPHELLVELKDFSGNFVYARYDRFEIGDEERKYDLKILGAYTGTAGDSLTQHKSMKFTTVDRDNDARSSGNCASSYKGAWWYKDCHYSNLNGLYKNVEGEEVMSWESIKKKNFGLAYSRMSIREI